MGELKKEEAKREPQYLPSEINTKMVNYRVYKMKAPEKLLFFILTVIVGGIVGLVFYANLFMVDGEPTKATYISNLIVFFGVGITAAVKFLPLREEQLRDKRKNILNLQFREMLAALASAFSAGENMLGAFQSTQKEMTMQFGKDSYIAKETREIVEGMNSNITIEKLLKNFASRSGVEDIENFSDIISICYAKGGDMRGIVQNTYDLIGDKISISEEIKTKLTSNKMQQNVMSIVPIVLIGYLRISSSSFAQSFASFTGVIVMTVAAGIFIASYLYGRRITNIKG